MSTDKPMTIEELRAVPGNSLRVNQVAAFLGMNPQSIRYMARTCPELLGFPVCCYQSEGAVTWHCLIPKEAFIAWVTGANLGARKEGNA